MGVAHVCAGCGESLTRVRAFDDPHYGLKLVRCPRCGRVETRRRHPILSGWRWAHQLRVLGARAVGTTIVLTLLTVLMLVGLAGALRTLEMINATPTQLGRWVLGQRFGGVGGWPESMAWGDLAGPWMMFTVCSIATGAVMGASLTHCGIRRLCIGWGVVLGGGFMLTVGCMWGWEVLEIQARRAEQGMPTSIWSASGWENAGFDGAKTLDVGVGLVVSAGLTAPGVVLGRVVARAGHGWAAVQWRRRRRRMKRRRESR